MKIHINITAQELWFWRASVILFWIFILAGLLLPNYSPEDFNKDGQVNLQDLSIFLSRMDK